LDDAASSIRQALVAAEVTGAGEAEGEVAGAGAGEGKGEGDGAGEGEGKSADEGQAADARAINFFYDFMFVKEPGTK